MEDGCIRITGWLTTDVGQLNVGVYAADCDFIFFSLFFIIWLLLNETEENFLSPTYFLGQFFFWSSFTDGDFILQFNWCHVKYELFRERCSSILLCFWSLSEWVFSTWSIRKCARKQKQMPTSFRLRLVTENCGYKSTGKSVGNDAITGKCVPLISY